MAPVTTHSHPSSRPEVRGTLVPDSGDSITQGQQANQPSSGSEQVQAASAASSPPESQDSHSVDPRDLDFQNREASPSSTVVAHASSSIATHDEKRGELHTASSGQSLFGTPLPIEFRTASIPTWSDKVEAWLDEAPSLHVRIENHNNDDNREEDNREEGNLEEDNDTDEA